jgi:hypothetical protein
MLDGIKFTPFWGWESERLMEGSVILQRQLTGLSAKEKSDAWKLSYFDVRLWQLRAFI